MPFKLEGKLLNMAKVFSLIDEERERKGKPRKLKREDIELLKGYYRKSEKPQLTIAPGYALPAK